VTTLSYDSREEDWDQYEPEQDDQLPRRPRRQFFTRRTAALAAVITCAAGFYAGVRIEKSQLSGSSSSFTVPSLAAAGATGSRAAGASTGSRSLPAGVAALAGGFGGANSTVGQVSSVDGRTLYVKDSSGNVEKVTLSSAAKISKSLAVSKNSVRPGDTVVVQGLKNAKGVLVATSVSDSGASSSGSSSTGSSSAGSSGSASGSVGSLFSGGSGSAGG